MNVGHLSVLLERRCADGAVLNACRSPLSHHRDLASLPQAIEGAMRELQLLGAVTSSEPPELTPLGRRMASFPLDPKFARAILASKDHGCT